jgi:chromosome segregation ATPase
MVVGVVCPEENVVRALQEKVDDLDRLVHGLLKSESETNQLESTVKQQNETISALAEKVNTLMSVNAVNGDKFSKLQTTVDDQALQVANIPKMMADISSYEANSKDVVMPDVQPTVDIEIITAIETKIYALETALESANTSIDAQTSAFENRIEQIEDSVKKVTTDQNTLPSNDRVEKIEAILFDSTGITRQVEMLDNRIRAQECLPRVPPSLATKLGALELNIENLGTRMKNYEDAVTDVRQNYHRYLDAIDGVKRTVQEYAEGLDAVRAQIEIMRKHIDAIDDDLAKDDKRMQVLKNMVQTLDQKVKADSEDLTKLYRRVGECEDAYLRLSGEEDAQHRPSSPLAPIDESSSEEDHVVNTTMATKGSGDTDIASPDQTPMDGVKAEDTGITEDFTASTVNNEAVNDEDLKDADPGLARPPNVGDDGGITEEGITASTSSDKEAANDEDAKDTDTGSVRPPSVGEDTGIAEDPKASTSDKEAVNDEATMDTDPGSKRPPSVGDNLTKDLLSGYKRSDEESGSNGSEGHGSGSVPAVQPQHVSSGEVDAGKADAAGEKDDKDGVE